jgi:hypothetical protein
MGTAGFRFVYGSRGWLSARARTREMNANRSFRDARRMNWVTGPCGVTLEKIEFHEGFAPLRVELLMRRKEDGA